MYNSWCGPCEALSRKIQQLETQMASLLNAENAGSFAAVKAFENQSMQDVDTSWLASARSIEPHPPFCKPVLDA